MKHVLGLFALCAGLLTAAMLAVPQPAQAQVGSWLDPWSARHEITVPNPCGAELTDYQVQITLDATFDFNGALPDGSDVVITGDDGVTCIPYWIETWDPASERASIWVKVATIPLAGATVYLYYGNPTPGEPDPPELVEVGPIGPWDKQTTNIVPTGGPAGGASLLAENVVYDDVTGHYWMVFANYNDGSVGLAWTDDLDDPASWSWHGSVVPSANAPHIIYHAGLWYIFYADQSYSMPGRPISVSTATSITGPYTEDPTPVLVPSETWEAARVDEPYVFQRNDGKWILMYMGDAGGTTEQVGYAEADAILGPYTKFGGNPCIPFGPPGSIDAGTVADPWVVELDDVYYIGYTVSSTKSSPWRTALVTTTDWLTFTKEGITLDLGGPDDWDERNAFRGAVTRFGDTYYFPYTGRRTSGGYLMGMATMDAFQLVYPPVCHDPDAVFEFIDTFDGDALDTEKWVRSGGSASVAGGICTLTGTPGDYLQMRATTAVGTGTLLEARASHLDAGLNPGSDQGNTAAEVGYKSASLGWDPVMRIMDWPDLTYYCIQATSSGNNSTYIPTAVPFDTDWHTYGVYRTTAGDVEFHVDVSVAGSLGSPYVSTASLYPWLMSYSRSPAATSRFLVDWAWVRKFCGSDVTTVVSAVEYAASDIFGHVYEAAVGLEGVAIMLLDNASNPYDGAVTDGSGYYEFTEVPVGDYTVTVSTPLGYVADQETHAVTVAGDDVEIDFNLTKMAIPMAQRGRGYWMHQVNALLTGKGRAHETMADMCDYLELIHTHFNTHNLNPITILNVDPDYDCSVWLTALRDIISPRPKSSMSDKAKAHLTALLLNMVSGKIAQWAEISADGATVSQAITYCDMLIGDTDPANDEVAKDIAEMINEGEVVPSGWVDLATPDYLYKGAGSLPTTFALHQNVPNPFNMTTEIRLSLPERALTRLEIFNVMGQKVVTLADREMDAGNHVVHWDGRNSGGDIVGSGVYFYRLEAGGHTATKKMVLVK